MMRASFCFVPGVTLDQERSLWSRGILTWELAKQHSDEVTDAIGQARSGKLLTAINEAEAALAKRDHAWFASHWPVPQQWRLWRGYCANDQIACVDIETTGMTPGFDQVTVIGMADGAGTTQAYVWHRPQTGDEALDRFPPAFKGRQLTVTFNGAGFDVPFLETRFKDIGWRCDMPHFDTMFQARSLGFSGGFKAIEQQLGITRDESIKEVRGLEAISLAGAWKANSDAKAYTRLVTYCKADAANLVPFAEAIYTRMWAREYTPFAKTINFAATKGEQLTLF